MKQANGKRGPDFIGIGPPKTGTSWMYNALAQHSQVWMPPVKEIRYFWEKAFVEKSGLLKRVTGSHWHHAEQRRWFIHGMNRHWQNLLALRVDKKSLWWELKFMALPRTDQWYLSLFDRQKISGDVSPNYHELPERAIEKVRDLLPEVKIIISLRNPVERAWSMAKMLLCQNANQKIEEIAECGFVAFWMTQKLRTTGNYVRLIERWKKYFPAKNILIVFIDELQTAPVLFFEKICRFLEIPPPDEHLKKTIAVVQNKGIEGALPQKLGGYLYQQCRPAIVELIETLPNVEYPRQWLAELSAKYDRGAGVHLSAPAS